MNKQNSSTEENASSGNAVEDPLGPIPQHAKNLDNVPRKAIGDRQYSNASDPDEFIKVVRDFRRWFLQQDIQVHQWIQALASVALLAVTFGQFWLALSGQKQSTELADAAQKNADSAYSFAQSAWAINWGISQSVLKLQAQADRIEDARTLYRESIWRRAQSG